MEKKILKKRQSASQETKELSEQGAEKSNSGLITAGMLLYSKTELSEARGRLFLVESVDAETGEITALGLLHLLCTVPADDATITVPSGAGKSVP